MLIGCIGALAQTKIKRFLAYSSMNQLSLFLITTVTGNVNSIVNGVTAMFIYSITLFLFIVLLNRANGSQNTSIIYFKDLLNIRLYNKKIAYTIVLLLSSMSGLPPFIGFFTKFFIILDFIQNGFFFLSFYILVINLVSVYYYIKVIKCLFFERPMLVSIKKNKSSNIFLFWEKTNYCNEIEDFGIYFFLSTTLFLLSLKYIPSLYLFVQYIILDQFITGTCLPYNNF